MRKFGACLLAVAVGIAGMTLMFLAGIVAVLITDPLYPFAPVFLPLALLVVALTAWAMGRVPLWLYPTHPDRLKWTRIGQAVGFLGMSLWGIGIYRFCTMPMHWQ